MPEVSICLTTYNRAHVLGATIESILAQTFADFELIISDDNSPDGTRALCESYAAKDARIRYYRNEQNLKMPGNLNHAISKATGRYVANLHDGDIYQPDLIRKWKEALDRYPEALFVFNGYVIEDIRGGSFTYIHPGFEPINDGRVLIDYQLTHFSSAAWGTVMVRREAYEQYGTLNAEYGFISDVEMWLRLATKGKVAYVPEALITLTPREKTHNYYYPHWNVTRNNFRILRMYYEAFGLPEKDIPFINQRIRKFMWREWLVLVKHRQWQRVREGLGLFRHAPHAGMRLLSWLIPLPALPVQGFSAQQFWDETLLNTPR